MGKGTSFWVHPLPLPTCHHAQLNPEFYPVGLREYALPCSFNSKTTAKTPLPQLGKSNIFQTIFITRICTLKWGHKYHNKHSVAPSSPTHKHLAYTSKPSPQFTVSPPAIYPLKTLENQKTRLPLPLSTVPREPQWFRTLSSHRRVAVLAPLLHQFHLDNFLHSFCSCR